MQVAAHWGEFTKSTIDAQHTRQPENDGNRAEHKRATERREACTDAAGKNLRGCDENLSCKDSPDTHCTGDVKSNCSLQRGRAYSNGGHDQHWQTSQHQREASVMEYTYTIHIRDGQIKKVDSLIRAHMKNNPDATVDDALDHIFNVGANVIAVANSLVNEEVKN